MTTMPPNVLAAILLGVWLLGLVGYFVWAIHRYVLNWGLSEREWKIINPYAYASDKELAHFVERRAQLLEARRAAREDTAASEAGTTPRAPVDAGPTLVEPAASPYERDSFGLPPGTIRGAIALTALVMFLAVEAVNLAVGGSGEANFPELVTCFQMVLAFYFGSRAVEVLQARSQPRTPSTASGLPAEEQAATVAPAVSPTRPQLPDAAPPPPRPVAPPSEQPALAARFLPDRLESMVIPAVQGGGPPADGLKRGAALEQRVLALTASFETGRGFPECFGVVAGDFDGMGISFGALQWNIGKGSLQPLLARLDAESPRVVEEALGPALAGSLRAMLRMDSRAEQLAWARSIQLTRTVSGRSRWVVNEAWRVGFERLGSRPEMIDLQVHEALNRYEIALANCRIFDLWSERAVALLFDINVQNGRVDESGAGDRIRADFLALSPGLSREEREIERMLIIARRRSEVSRMAYRQDVLERKTCIARGSGTVHRRAYDLAREFDLKLVEVPELKLAPGIAA